MANEIEQVYCYPKTREFLQTAIAEGAHRIEPAGISSGVWNRQRNIMGVYFASPASQAEIGREYGVTRERIRQLVNTGLIHLWNQCSAETQTRYPLSEIPRSKPSSKTTNLFNRRRVSIARGGRSAKVADTIQAGFEDAEDIISISGIPREELSKIRTTLGGWGVAVPYLTSYRLPEENNQLEKELGDPDKSDEEIQSLLDKINIGFYHPKRLNKQNPVILSVANLVYGLGFHPPSSTIELFVDQLKQAKIPVGQLERTIQRPDKTTTVSYYFFASIHRDRVAQALTENETLKKYLENPVQQVCGSGFRHPSTWELVTKREFHSVSSLLAQYGIYSKKVSPLVDILSHREDSLAVFKYRRCYYYPVEQEEILRRVIIEVRALQGYTL